jgi:hypothetical protein
MTLSTRLDTADATPIFPVPCAEAPVKVKAVASAKDETVANHLLIAISRPVVFGMGLTITSIEGAPITPQESSEACSACHSGCERLPLTV